MSRHSPVERGARGDSEAGNGVDETGQLGALGELGTGGLRGIDLRQQVEDPTGVGHDYRPHVGRLGGERSPVLPSADRGGVLLAHPTDLQDGVWIPCPLRQLGRSFGHNPKVDSMR